MPDKDSSSSQEGETKQVVFHYIKSNHFRVVHADGAWGGITPRGLIQASVYSERSAIPKRMIHKVKEDGQLGDEIPELRSSREGIVREIEVEVIWDLAGAKSFLKWLGEKIENLEKQKTEEGG